VRRGLYNVRHLISDFPQQDAKLQTGDAFDTLSEDGWRTYRQVWFATEQPIFDIVWGVIVLPVKKEIESS